MEDPLIAANLVVRFMLEVVGIASLGYWWWRLPTITPAKVALAAAAPSSWRWSSC